MRKYIITYLDAWSGKTYTAEIIQHSKAAAVREVLESCGDSTEVISIERI